jgi:citrate lyase subunit alpha/citrate CoA-transferase
MTRLDWPAAVPGYGPVIPFAGVDGGTPPSQRHAPGVKVARRADTKVVSDLETLFRRIPVRDGMTFSFHHHLRNGDGVVNAVLATAAKLGIKNLTLALSAVYPVHAPLVEHIKQGTVRALDTDYISGPVADAVSHGLLAQPVIMRTHGGRARAIESGQRPIDVAFIAAPTADPQGNLTGISGPNACGALGYAMPDAAHADWVVGVTDNLVPYPLTPISIPQTQVDFVVPLGSIGDAGGIVSGITRIAQKPEQMGIAKLAAKIIDAAGLICDGFSFQTGAGGTSLAVTQFVRTMMTERGVVGSFALGGITGALVEMLEAGLFARLLDVQAFDLAAVRSLATNPNHLEISAGHYASPWNSGCAVDQLDCVILGATEIATNFNVNVTTGSDGMIRGGSGGHSDAAAGAKVAIVVTPLRRGPWPIVRDTVTTVTTPGETIDLLITDAGVAVNPQRADLLERLAAAELPLKSIAELRTLAGEPPQQPVTNDKLVAIVEYRDGTVIDVVRSID